MSDGISIDIEKVGDDVIMSFNKQVTIRLESGDAAHFAQRLLAVSLLGGSVVTDESIEKELFPRG